MYIYYETVGNILRGYYNEDDILDKERLGSDIVEKFERIIKENLQLKCIFNTYNDKEKQSWKNSIPELLEKLKDSNLENLYVIFEYCLPIGRNRIDCIVVGEDRESNPTILVVELKQWKKLFIDMNNDDPCKVRLTETDMPREHPVAQIQSYSKYLAKNHSFCIENNIIIHKCAFLHNFENKDTLFNNEYQIYKKDFYEYTFTKRDSYKFMEYLKSIFINKAKLTYVKNFVNGEYVTGEDGVNKLREILSKPDSITLLNEQRNIISLFQKKLNEMKIVDHITKADERIVGIISGNVGSGKTILAFEMLRRAMSKFNNKNCIYSLVNATVRDILEGVFDSKIALYTGSVARSNQIKNIVIIDEAHRITDIEATIKKLIDKSRILIIFQDDNQRILPREEGTLNRYIEVIENLRKSYNIKYLSSNNKNLSLKMDFRTSALSDYISNLNKFLEDDEVVTSTYSKQFYDLQVNDTLESIDNKLKYLNKDYTCKWMASFCWKWSYNTNNNDVNIKENNFQKAWNPKRNRDRQLNWYLNKYENHLNEVGCIYTVQGLDFDYTGVIFWDDLYWKNGKWNIDLNKIKDHSYLINDFVSMYNGQVSSKQKDDKWVVTYNNREMDIEEFIQIISLEVGRDINEEIKVIVKNIYRVLLSRGKKGQYVWFKDDNTKKRFKKIFNL